MFTFIVTASIGAYLSRRINVMRDDAIADIAINYQRIWSDAIALLALIGFTCNWVIGIARSSRNYFDLALIPWFARNGISIVVPQIDLPRLAATEHPSCLIR